MIQLYISLLAASVVVRFTTPGPGDYYLCSIESGSNLATVEASDWTEKAVHVTATVDATEASRVWFLRFEPCEWCGVEATQ